MAKKPAPTPEDHPIGNTDPDKRGRGSKIGQQIPKRVREKIDPRKEDE